MTGRPSERVVWIVSEGSPGHVSQSVGLAEALAKQFPIHVERVECRPRLNGAARSLVRMWMGRSGRPLPGWVLKRWLCLDLSATSAPKPDIIFSSGGKSVFAARTLAARYGAPYIFLGERKPYPSEWFHTVFTPSIREQGRHDVQVEMIPTQVTKVLAERAALSWPDRPEGRIWAMVIGGSSVSHHFDRDEWTMLAGAMNDLAAQNGIRWVVTTSRRTGSMAEEKLKTALEPKRIAEAVWWSQKPDKKLMRYLGAAECVFVTQDSVTMITEAISSGRPVVVIRPGKVNFPLRSFMIGYFQRLAAARRSLFIQISALRSFKLYHNDFLIRSQPINDEIASILLSRLGNWR